MRGSGVCDLRLIEIQFPQLVQAAKSRARHQRVFEIQFLEPGQMRQIHKPRVPDSGIGKAQASQLLETGQMHKSGTREARTINPQDLQAGQARKMCQTCVRDSSTGEEQRVQVA